MRNLKFQILFINGWDRRMFLSKQINAEETSLFFVAYKVFCYFKSQLELQLIELVKSSAIVKNLGVLSYYGKCGEFTSKTYFFLLKFLNDIVAKKKVKNESHNSVFFLKACAVYKNKKASFRRLGLEFTLIAVDWKFLYIKKFSPMFFDALGSE